MIRPDPTRERPRRDQGSALMLVFIATIALATMAAFVSVLTFHRSAFSRENGQLTREAIACESVAELLRLEVVSDFELAGLSAESWMHQVREGTRFDPTRPSRYAGFPDVHAWIDAVSPYGAGDMWVEIVAAPIPGSGLSTRSYRTRVALRDNRILDHALLAESAGCVFCHVQVTGDVGAIGDLEPGSGSNNSGVGSAIIGDVRVSGRAANGTGAHSGTINGTTYTGELHEGYTGPLLPADADDDGMPDLPVVQPRTLSALAHGAVWAGGVTNDANDGSGIWVTPLLGSWDVAGERRATPPESAGGTTWRPSSRSAVPSVIDGNVTLVGTTTNPIEIDGDVFVRGDLVIKGHVSGRGAIYSGRNVYIAGDIVYTDGPASISSDSDAVAAIEAGKDELRLAARSNVIVGDWTYRDADGSVRPFRDRQGQAFLRDQYLLDTVRHYLATDGLDSSHEVFLRDGRFFDDSGAEVAAADVVTVDASSEIGWSHSAAGRLEPTRFDSVVAPGQVLADGSFRSWIDHTAFRDIVGTETYRDYTWRMPRTTDSTTIDDELGSGWSTTLASIGNGDAWYDDDARGAAGEGQYVHLSSWAIHVLETGARTLSRQVSRIDAYLFSNQRIGGHVSNVAGLTINGGVATRGLGLLAPGVGNELWWVDSNSIRGGDTTLPPLAWQSPDTSPWGDAQDALRIRYDHRMRNGGTGFGLLAPRGASIGTGDRIYAVREGLATPPLAVP